MTKMSMICQNVMQRNFILHYSKRSSLNVKNKKTGMSLLVFPVCMGPKMSKLA